MIKIHDSILPVLLELSRSQLIVYMLINRYLMENEDIPLDHIHEISKLTEHEFFGALRELEKLTAFVIKVTTSPAVQGGIIIEILDSINEKTGVVSFRRKSSSYIYTNSIESYKNSINNKSIGIKDKESQTENLPPESPETLEAIKKVNKKFKRGLTKIHNLIVKNDANALVDYFADCQLRLYPELRLNASWRTRQFSTAQKILKNYDYTVDLWKEGVDFLEKQEYWQDKLSSLKQVENNIHQLMVRKKKAKSRKKSKVKKIK